MHNIYEKVITMPVWEKIDSKIIMTNPKEHRKSGHTREIHKFCDRMVINFIYDFFFIGYFCLVCYCQFYHTFCQIMWKISNKVWWCFSDCFECIQGNIDFKTAHTRRISWSLSWAHSFFIEWINDINRTSQMICIWENFVHYPFNK